VIDEILTAVHRRVASDTGGDVATYVPALAAADPEAFGIAVTAATGAMFKIGDADVPFTIQSVSKPFSLALALDRAGHDAVYARVGSEPSGDAFNSVLLNPDGRPFNPMVNAGALAVAGLLRDEYRDDAFEQIRAGYERFAGSPLGFDDAVYRSEIATAHRNRAIAQLLRQNEVIGDSVEEVIDLYTRQCSLTVTAAQLATMAATLANIGTNPITRVTVADPLTVRHVLSLMFTCGMYDYAGGWAVDVGMPAKSGVSGDVMAVVNRQIGMGLYSPRLDQHGNSVRGIKSCVQLAEELGLHAFEFSNAGSSLLGVYL
jgi:glutaminase